MDHPRKIGNIFEPIFMWNMAYYTIMSLVHENILEI